MSNAHLSSGWSLITVHHEADVRILLGDPLRCIGLSPECVRQGLTTQVVGPAPSPCPWQEPSDEAVRYLIRDSEGRGRWVESRSERDAEGRLVVATRECLPALAGDAMVQMGRLTLSASLLSGFAHEINNIVQGIAAAEYLFRDCVESGDEIEVEDLDHLSQTASHLKDLGMGLQRFVRTPLVAPVSLDLSTTVTEAVDFLTQSGRLKHMNVALEFDEDLPALTWRAADLGFILTGLLANAADAAYAGVRKPVIRISAIRREDRVEICIKDNGRGFADESKSLKPFVTSKDTNRHLGFGLSAITALIATYGGSLSFSRVDDQTHTSLLLPLSV